MLSWLLRQFHRLPVFWRFQTAGWGAFSIYGLVSRCSFWDSVAMGVAMTLVMEPMAVLLSTGLRQVYSRLQLRSGFSLRTVAVVLFCSVFAAWVDMGVASWCAPHIANLLDVPLAPSRFLSRVMLFWAIFSGWSVAYLWLKAEFQAKLKQDQLVAATAAAQRAELQMLRLQLNPHFMFNALNNIATEIPEHPENALEMTHDLADFLRYSMDQHGGLIAPLSREVEAMTSYLNIEQRRFGKRLRSTVTADPAALRTQVPCFLLQPLVENAVKHGLNSSQPPWELSVDVARENGGLRVLVRNTGNLMPDWETRQNSGIGVINLRRRLELHYPSRYRVNLRQDGPLVCSEIVIKGEPCQV
jgi:two-component system LytT family sensor kinase